MSLASFRRSEMLPRKREKKHFQKKHLILHFLNASLKTYRSLYECADLLVVLVSSLSGQVQ